MLDKIKQAIFQKYKKTDNKWIFLSAISDKNELLISSGTIFSDKELEKLVETLYHWLIENYNNISHIIIDIVTDIQEVKQITEIQNISLKDNGLLVTSEKKSGILLPNTTGITDIALALKAIKQKNNLEWKTIISKFQTDRIAI